MCVVNQYIKRVSYFHGKKSCIDIDLGKNSLIACYYCTISNNCQPVFLFRQRKQFHSPPRQLPTSHPDFPPITPTAPTILKDPSAISITLYKNVCVCWTRKASIKKNSSLSIHIVMFNCQTRIGRMIALKFPGHIRSIIITRYALIHRLKEWVDSFKWRKSYFLQLRTKHDLRVTIK